MGGFNYSVVVWAPPEWACNSFPMEAPSQQEMEMERLVAILNALLDTSCEADYTPLQKVLHVAHILVTMQGPDGLWPAKFHLKTGNPLTCERTHAPVALFKRLNSLLSTTEFNRAIWYATEGRISSKNM